MKIDVALEPSEIARLSERDLSRTSCVVFDVLRATSSMLTGLASGVVSLKPVCTIEEALEERRRDPSLLLGGERHGERIEGFDLGNSPFEYREHAGQRIVTTTTNGTVALRACAGADRVWVGAVLNLEALARALHALSPEGVLLVCAGTFETLALEDVWAAGRLMEMAPSAEWTDAARVAFATRRSCPNAMEALANSRNGKALLAKGRENELEWCAKESVYDLVAEMRQGEVRVAIGREHAIA